MSIIFAIYCITLLSDVYILVSYPGSSCNIEKLGGGAWVRGYVYSTIYNSWHQLVEQLIFVHSVDLSIDWITDKIYWIDTNLDFIGVLDLKAGVHKTLVNISNEYQSHYYRLDSAMVIDPSTR